MLSPRWGGGGGATLGICGAFDFWEEFLVKLPPWGPKMGQIRSNIRTLGK